MNQTDVKHLIPDERSKTGGLWRDARTEDEHKRADLAVETVFHKVDIQIEAKDPLTVALLFRELRQAAGDADVNNASVELSFTLSRLTEDGAHALKVVSELSWAHVYMSDPEVETIYYRKVYGQD